MRSALRRRTVYIGTVIAILAMSAGFVLATGGVLLTHTSQNAMGDSTAGVGTVTGISYVSTELNVTSNSMTYQSTALAFGKPSAPVALVADINAYCVSAVLTASPVPCTAGDFAEVANFSFSTSFAGAAEFTMYVNAGSTSGIQSLFVKQAATAVGGNILLY
ncbi:MAG: hypothetical protein ACYDFT_04935, partial [Thermoplasmata archaeon]